MDHLEDILREFADRIRSVVKEEMLEVLLSGEPMTVKRGPGRPPKALATAPKTRRKKGQKRDPREINSLTVQLGSAIKTGPGSSHGAAREDAGGEHEGSRDPREAAPGREQDQDDGQQTGDEVFSEVK